MHLTPAFRLAAIATVFVAAACHSKTSTGARPATGGGTAARATAARPAARPADVTPANITLGDSIFNNGSCQNCHGKLGVGGVRAPALDGKKWLQLKTGSYDEIVAIITTGVPAAAIKDTTHKNPMNPRGGRANLSDPQIKAVAAYVWTLTHK